MKHPRHHQKLVILAHLRKPWDTLFMPGEVAGSPRVRAMWQAIHDQGINVLREYRADYPAKGLSGVLFTRLPDHVEMPVGWQLAHNRWSGLGL